MRLTRTGTTPLLTSDPVEATSEPTLFQPAPGTLTRLDQAAVSNTGGTGSTPPTSQVDTPRIGARVLLLDQHNRVLLIHARDPDNPDHHWWELPGGGVNDGESLEQTARREITEETGIELGQLGPQVWTRESRFRYRGRHHHRIDHVFLATCAHPEPTAATTYTENEKAGLIEHTWFTATELHNCPDKLMPAELPTLLEAILAGNLPQQPIHLFS